MYGLHLKPVTNEGLRFVLKLVGHLLAKLTARPTNIFPASALRSQFQASLSARKFSLSARKFSLSARKFFRSYKKVFVTKLVTLVRNFVTRVTKFVIYISKFVINFPAQMVKNITGLGKFSKGVAKNICLEKQARRQGRPLIALNMQRRLRSWWNLTETMARLQ